MTIKAYLASTKKYLALSWLVLIGFRNKARKHRLASFPVIVSGYLAALHQHTVSGNKRFDENKPPRRSNNTRRTFHRTRGTSNATGTQQHLSWWSLTRHRHAAAELLVSVRTCALSTWLIALQSGVWIWQVLKHDTKINRQFSNTSF